MREERRAYFRKRAGILTALLFICAFAATAYGYGTATGARRNALALGTVSCGLEETFEGPFPGEDGEHFTKAVYAENRGTVPCRVRIFMDFADPRAREAALLTRDGQTWHDYGTFSGLDADRWSFADGWFYYNAVLLPGERTSWLLKEVLLPPDLAGVPVSLLVYAECVNAGSGEESCREAFAGGRTAP